jgi:putative FmdB family regulatory protein
MPIYSYRCPLCEVARTEFRKIAERERLPECDGCRVTCFREVSAPALAPMFQEFISPVSGKRITSRASYAYDLEATGSIAYEPGLKQDIARNRKAALQKSVDLALRRTDETIAALDASGRLS